MKLLQIIKNFLGKFLSTSEDEFWNKIQAERREREDRKQFVKENFNNYKVLSRISHKMLDVDIYSLREILINKNRTIIIKFEQNKTGDTYQGEAQFLTKFYGAGSLECKNACYKITDLFEKAYKIKMVKENNRIILDISYSLKNIKIECESVKIINFNKVDNAIEWLKTHSMGQIPEILPIIIK